MSILQNVFMGLARNGQRREITDDRQRGKAAAWIRLRRATILAVVFAVLLGGLWLAGEYVGRRLSISFVVPHEYTGYLVSRWECPGGVVLARDRFGRLDKLTVSFDDKGTACIADPIPRGGFRITGFHYDNGVTAPVIVGGTRGLQGARPPGEMEYIFSPLASIGIGDSRVLGDECTLHEFLATRFGVSTPPAPLDCPPIYVLPNPAISATPGSPAVAY